jgi:uncharacterized protein
MRSYFIAFVVAAGFLFAPSVQAQSDSLLKTNDIRILLDLMNVGTAMQRSLIDEIATGRTNAENGLPPQFWDEFEKEALSTVPAFIERLIPSYDRQFSHAEIKSLIAIYQNPAMKKMAELEPVLSEASGKAGEAWGEEIGLRVALKLDMQIEEATPAENVKDTGAKQPAPAKKKK